MEKLAHVLRGFVIFLKALFRDAGDELWDQNLVSAAAERIKLALAHLVQLKSPEKLLVVAQLIEKELEAAESDS